MRLFLIVQGSSLGVFHRIIRHLKEHTAIEMVSYYVSGGSFYERFVSHEQNISINGEVLKGWEVVERGLKRRPGVKEIEKWEKKLRIESLWPAIIADRRMIYGKECKVKQDYKPRYSLEELKGITVETVESLWESFEKMKPQVVLSFSPSTIGAYVAGFVARALAIPMLTLKSTKISNYVTFSEDFLERHEHIRKRYHEYLKEGQPDPEVAQSARGYIRSAREKRVLYEGSLIARKEPLTLSLYRFIKGLPRAAVSDFLHAMGSTRLDPHYQRHIQYLWHYEIARRWRKRTGQRVLNPLTISPSMLKDLPFVFFPLNSEPEIALSVYSRFTLNQIEVIRNIAQSLSLGMYLVVKEHPRSWGLRSKGYYKRLLEIPNVRIVPVETPTNEVIRHARATIVISSFVGFESLLMGVPVLTLGNCSYDMLPEVMSRKVHSFGELPLNLRKTLEEYMPDESVLECFVAAVMKESVPIDLYSSMLNKGGRERGTNAIRTASLEEQYERTAIYLKRRIEEVLRKSENRRK